MRKCLFVLSFLMSISSVNIAQVKTDAELKQVLEAKASSSLKQILADPLKYEYQIIYTRIDRDKENKPHFSYSYLNVDKERYFYPASTVKLPAAILSLEKLNNLSIPGLDKHTSMLSDSAHSKQTPVYEDATSETGLPSIAHYIRKVFLVSDNDAYSRLFEWLGQEYLNGRLWEMGYRNTRIPRRFFVMSFDEHRHTNPVRFVKGDQVIYSQPAAVSAAAFDMSKKHLIPRKYLKDGDVVLDTLDLSMHNAFPLEDQQQMLQAVLFPQAVASHRRFRLSGEDYPFLRSFMSMLPSQSAYPAYDTSKFKDNHAKFFFLRSAGGKLKNGVRIYNKAGWAYNFVTDNAYIVDFENKVEFMLAAVINLNMDGDQKNVMNEKGRPFFEELCQIIYEHELKGARKYKPVLIESLP